jgi:hypothetical protein
MIVASIVRCLIDRTLLGILPDPIRLNTRPLITLPDASVGREFR